MVNLKTTSLAIPKVGLILGGWGLVLLLGGVMSQWFELKVDFVLWLWGGVTLLGLLAQGLGMVRGLGLNLSTWLILIVVGWLLTFYVIKFENGAHSDLFGDLPGLWLLLLSMGYVATAFQVSKLFLGLAGLHLLVGFLMELSIRQVLTLDFLDLYSSIIFGLVSGLPLLIAAWPGWYKTQTQEQADPVLNMTGQRT